MMPQPAAAAAVPAAASSRRVLQPAAASRLLHSSSVARSDSPLAGTPAPAAGTKKMNLFTALNDAMSEALRTDPKASAQRVPCMHARNFTSQRLTHFTFVSLRFPC